MLWVAVVVSFTGVMFLIMLSLCDVCPCKLDLPVYLKDIKWKIDQKRKLVITGTNQIQVRRAVTHYLLFWGTILWMYLYIILLIHVIMLLFVLSGYKGITSTRF